MKQFGKELVNTSYNVLKWLYIIELLIITTYYTYMRNLDILVTPI